jgi:hypothetical protein
MKPLMNCKDPIEVPFEFCKDPIETPFELQGPY